MKKISKPKVILLIETSRAYGRALLRGITKYSRLHGPWVFYSEPGGLEKVLPHLKGWGANGIIMRDSRKGEDESGGGGLATCHGMNDELDWRLEISDWSGRELFPLKSVI